MIFPRLAEYSSPTNKAIEKRQLAVKIVNRRRAPDDFIRKFLPRELSLLRQISHENIIKIYEIHDSGAQVYVIMEYAENGDLLELVRVGLSSISGLSGVDQLLFFAF